MPQIAWPPLSKASVLRPAAVARVQVELAFVGELWFWRGPAPWHYVTVPDEESAAIEAVSGLVSYGWGVIPVTATVGHTTWPTSLFPKDERYLVPVKAAVRKAEGLELGDDVEVRLTIDM